MDLPLGLRTSIESGRAVLFVGAGIGHDVTDSDGNVAPDAAKLANELGGRFSIDVGAEAELAKVSKIVELRKGRAELLTFLTKRLAHLEPNEHVRELAKQRWAAIFTTNYDRVLERAYELEPHPPQTPIVISATSHLCEVDPRFNVPLYHLHGALFSGDQPDILITQEDYARFGERRRMLFELLKQRFATNAFLYIGYSQRDTNWHTLQSEMRTEFTPGRPPRSYRVAPSTDPLDEEILLGMEIETLKGYTSDLATAIATLNPDDSAHRLKQLESTVPKDLLAAFTENSAATARLLGSWEYVNDAAFDAPTNTSQYLRGDLPNWALAASNAAFTRDIEAPLYDDLLDFATGAQQRPTSVILLGAAGYGVSTVLMKTAAKLVKEAAGPVLMHRRGTPLTEGDIEFAVSALEGRPFFVIDNAADEGTEIASAVRRLRELNTPACFLLGERLNEWRQRRLRLSPTEFEIEPLSDGEIGRLLACLEQHGELNRLADLEPQLRVAAVKEKAEKQLLVAMREATEGKAFDAIIEDEYRAIASNEAQDVYAVVAGMHRLRIALRVDALAEVLGIGLVELYDAIGPEVEGIVLTETIDEHKGIAAVRARHPVIAEIIWERVVEPHERDRLLHRILTALNLTYVLDAKAFEALVRDDRGIDGISTFEGRIAFFDRAVSKDPEDPYVLQHYARMLMREKRHDTALAIIDRAIELRPKVRVLSHTKGIVLRDLALNTESPEIARRRLTQSEAALRQSFGPQRRDAYTWQTLAELYLGWAHRRDAEEAAEYIMKAEETVRDGLVKADDRSGLYIVSSKIEEHLGNRPEALSALRSAVKENSTDSVPRYLLARAQARDHNWDAVAETLLPVIEQDPQEYRSALLYARALEHTGAPYGKAIAVLRLADLYGRRDARFIATLGGMLTMDGEYTEAENVFAWARQSVKYSDSNRIEYRPHPSGDPTPVLEGTVINVKAGYAFIQCPGYPDFFSPGRNFADVIEMQRGLRVRFQPAFTARGGVVTNLHALS